MGTFDNPLAGLDPSQLQGLQQQPSPAQQQPGIPATPPPSSGGGDDPLEHLKGQLLQQYQQQTPPPVKGGRIKQLLGNFFSGMGSGMMHEAGMPTPYEQQQKTLSNLLGVSNAQAGMGYKEALASQYGTTPVRMPDGSTVNVLNKDVGKVYEGLARASATTQAAQIGGQSRVQAAQINQGMMMPVTEELRQALGLPQGTQQIPLRQLVEATTAATKPQTMVAGATDTYNVNKLTGDKTPLGVGSRTQAAAGARYVPVQDPTTGLTTYQPAAQASASGGLSPQSQLEKTAFTPKARFDDINRSTTFVNNALGALDQESSQRALIAKALADPASKEMGALKTFGNSELFKQLSPQSRDYVNGILSLREQIMGANAMLSGSAGVSDSRVRAIWDTLPGLEPDSDNARRKMTQVAGMIANLKEAFPQVKAVENLQRKASLANFSAPSDAPQAPSQDGHKLKDGSGKVIAISRGGKWTAP